MTREQHNARRRAVLAIAATALAVGFAAGYITAQATEQDPEPVQMQPAVVRTIPAPVPIPEAEPLPEPVYIGEFTATAYCPCVTCCGVWSADHPSRGEDYIQRTTSGTVPQAGRTIAADWDVLPEGMEIIIDGDTYTVEDTGSAIDGNRIDIYFDDHTDALAWGVQTVSVYKPS